MSGSPSFAGVTLATAMLPTPLTPIDPLRC